ncbi:hypothetical protein E3P92_01901 [Wallemia ichthyophaga]|nr:hypothetical protein E3P92_01901 [Wallemia ichthyophaga]TIB34518.1 hypothetical protein E3P84_01794 [Wallemia ichthyophaga]TIB41699.1 hypothetical protein E3P83_01680 [Wallemia ichthyophaga]
MNISQAHIIHMALLSLSAILCLATAAPVAKTDAEVHEISKRGLVNGIGSFFAVGLGACGAWSQPSDMVIALPTAHYAGGANCWKHYTVTNTNTGKVMDATAVDLCPTCQDNQIDLSRGLFSELTNGNMAQGLCDLTWTPA